MRCFSIVVAAFAVLGSAVAQSPIITACSTVSAVTVTSPAASCTVTTCAACDNGDAISSQASVNSVLRSSATSTISSIMENPPVTPSVIVGAFAVYVQALATPAAQVGALTCFSADDIDTLLNSLGDSVDQLDGLLQLYGDQISTDIGSSNYGSLITNIFHALNTRIESNFLELSLSRGCVDWTLFDSVNSKIDAFNTRFYSLATPDGMPRHSRLDSPCRDILTYSTISTACPTSACRATPVAESVCSSCSIAESSITSFQVNVAAATSAMSAAVAYASSTPFTQDGLYDICAAKLDAERNAFANTAADGICMNSEQSHIYLSGLTTYYQSLTWGFEQWPVLEFPLGGPYAVYYYLAGIPVSAMQQATTALQGRLSNPSTCFDCNDVNAYNAATTTFFERFLEYYQFMTGTAYPGNANAPQLTVDCSGACPTSSMSSIMSSTSASSSASSAEPSSSASSAESSAESSAYSADASSSVESSASTAGTSASSAPSSAVVSAEASSDTQSASADSSSQASASSTESSAASSSLEASTSGSASPVASAIPEYGSLSASSTTGYQNTSSVATSRSADPDAFSTQGASSITLTVVVTEACSACPGGSTTYTTTSVVCEACTATDSATSSRAPVHTFTSTAVITEPCSKCPGGSTTFTTTSVVTEPCDTTTAASVRTFTTTDVVTEPCSKCIGGSTTYTSTAVVTEACESTTSATTTPGTAAQVVPATDAEDATTYTITGIVTKTADSSRSSNPVVTVGSGSSVSGVREQSSTSVVAANAANKKTWTSLLVLLIPTLFGM